MKDQMENQVKEFKRHYCSQSSQRIDGLEFKIITCREKDFFYINRIAETGNHEVCPKFFFEKYNDYFTRKICVLLIKHGHK